MRGIEESSGKTTLAYTAPLPIVGFALDFGAERALYGGQFEAHFKGLNIEIVPYGKDSVKGTPDIRIYELPQPINIDSIRLYGKKELWAYFLTRCVEALTDPQIATVVVDTMTIARRVRADAYLQGLQEANERAGQPIRERLIQIEWGASNDSIRDTWTTGASTKKNLIGIHHLTDERQESLDASGKKEQVLTGNRVLDGLGQTNRLVDVAIRMEKKVGKLSGVLRKCGYELGLEGIRIENPTWDKLVEMLAMSTGDRIKFDRRKEIED